jgi:rare lipoprotein A
MMLRLRIHAGFVIVMILVTGAASCGKKTARIRPPAAAARIGTTETGIASWYGIPYHGRRTASGEVYDMEQHTAAHRKLPFETWVEVTNLENGKVVDVRINDRGPFVGKRIIDLSQAAARDIDMLGPGTARVRIRVIPPSQIATRETGARTSNGSSDPEERKDAIERSMASTSALSAAVVAKPATAPLAETPAAALKAIPLYAVQVGAFADRNRAESLREAVVEKFAEGRSLRTSAHSGLWKVLVGREMTLEQAQELAKRVRREFGDALIVAEPGAGADSPQIGDMPSRN